MLIFIENYAKTYGGAIYTYNMNYCTLKGVLFGTTKIYWKYSKK